MPNKLAYLVQWTPELHWCKRRLLTLKDGPRLNTQETKGIRQLVQHVLVICLLTVFDNYKSKIKVQQLSGLDQINLTIYLACHDRESISQLLCCRMRPSAGIHSQHKCMHTQARWCQTAHVAISALAQNASMFVLPSPTVESKQYNHHLH